MANPRNEGLTTIVTSYDPGDDPASIEFRIQLGTVSRNQQPVYVFPLQVDQNDSWDT